MRKFLLFALAISLGSIAFAAWPPDPLPQATCDFFGYPSWHNRSVKGCLTCPVYDNNGHRVTCESVAAANNGVINRDCCWLNTPKGQNLDPILGNCYTNGCVLGPNPWSVKCVCLLNCQMNPSPNCEQGCNNLPHPSPNPSNNPSCLNVNPNGGNGGNGGNAGNGVGHSKIVLGTNNGGNGGNGNNNGGNKVKKITTTPKPIGSNVKPSKPTKVTTTSSKSTTPAAKVETAKKVENAK